MVYFMKRLSEIFDDGDRKYNYAELLPVIGLCCLDTDCNGTRYSVVEGHSYLALAGYTVYQEVCGVGAAFGLGYGLQNMFF
jgi:hypothetical protein